VEYYGDEEEFRKGFRVGMALASFMILENIIKENYKDDYQAIKYKIRRLSEYEATLLIDDFCVSKQIMFTIF